MMWIIKWMLLTSCIVSGQRDPHYKDDRGVMVHLFEWKWDDIARECEEFLGPMGYGGVQVSPVNENLVMGNRPWYERYQPISYKLITRSGDEEDFKRMVKRCNAVDVRIFVDVVFNHMTGDSSPAVGVGGSTAETQKRFYPAVPFTADDFHPTCALNNYQNPGEVRNCELVGLHDLDQSKEHVRKEIVGFLDRLVDLGVAGFRVDAAKHMWPQDLGEIYGRVKNLSTEHGFPPGSRPFIFQEVIDFGGEAVKKQEYTHLGRVIEFTFGAVLGNTFRRNDPLKYLRNWANGWGLLAAGDALVMVDNHDNQRAGGASILTYKNNKPYKMALAFELAHPYATVRIMSSFDFSDFNQGPPATANGTIISPKMNSEGQCTNGWVCEHRWPQVYRMVQFRAVCKDSPVENWWDNGNHQAAFSRGDLGFVAFNNDLVDLKQNLTTNLPAGRYCDRISGDLVGKECTGRTIVVGNDRKAFIDIPTDDPNGVIAIDFAHKITEN